MAVNGANLTVGKGEIVAVIGPNGAGKTTLFNLITGALKRDSGKIIFKNEDISELPPYEICKKGISRSYQIVNIFSAGGVSRTNVSYYDSSAVTVTSGVGTSNTLAPLLTVNGSGYVPYLSCYSNSVVPTHTIRCQVLVDGVSVFDATTDSIASTANRGVYVVNSVPNPNETAGGMPIRFNSSLVVNACSSQSGTDFVAVDYEYQKT